MRQGPSLLESIWLLRAATFWNNLLALLGSSIFHKLILADVDGDGACAGVINWSVSLSEALLAVGYPFALASENLEHIDCHLLRHLLHQKLAAVFAPFRGSSPPRVFQSEGILCTNLHWFLRDSAGLRDSPSIHLPLPRQVFKLFLHFEAGCSGLSIDTGRHARPKVPRSQRRCLKCNSGQFCDEFHVNIRLFSTFFVNSHLSTLRQLRQCHSSCGRRMSRLLPAMLQGHSCLM